LRINEKNAIKQGQLRTEFVREATTQTLGAEASAWSQFICTLWRPSSWDIITMSWYYIKPSQYITEFPPQQAKPLENRLAICFI
jgi:hypothetical protein